MRLKYRKISQTCLHMIIIYGEQQDNYYYFKNNKYSHGKNRWHFLAFNCEQFEIFKLHLSKTFQPYSDLIDDVNMNTLFDFFTAI